MMKLISVGEVRATVDDGTFECDIVMDVGDGPEDAVFIARADDKYGLGPAVWAAIEGMPIAPYTPPPPQPEAEKQIDPRDAQIAELERRLSTLEGRMQ